MAANKECAGLDEARAMAAQFAVSVALLHISDSHRPQRSSKRQNPAAAI